MATPADIAAAVDRLSAGELVAFPTETVYGLGADARNPLAVRRIYAAKERPSGHPLIVHLASQAQVDEWGEFGEVAARLAAAFWPGPLTLVLRRKSGVLDEVTGGLETVGLRVPAHPVARALLDAFGDGVAAPSANRFGRVSPTTADHVRGELAPEVLVLDGGPCQVGIESTIVDLSAGTPALLRPGGVAVEEIEAIVGPLVPGSTAAPGTLPQHYAPSTALRLSDHPEETADALRAKGRLVAILPAGPSEDHARRLYAELRRLDGLGVDVLVAQRSPHAGLGRAINDRLQRAAWPGPSAADGNDKER